MADSRVLVIAHDEPHVLGYLGERAAQRSIEVVLHHRESPEPPPAPDGFDLIISMGSAWSVYDPDVASKVTAEKAVLRRAHALDLPVFGVCFGAQVLAEALGGEVRRADRPEVGWLTLRTSAPELVAAGPWLLWHHDVFSVPPGATLIAETDVGPQAFAAGSSLGVQFHPEATPDVIRPWLRDAPDLDDVGLDPSDLLSDTERRAPGARDRAYRLFDAACDRLVGALSAGSPPPVEDGATM